MPRVLHVKTARIVISETDIARANRRTNKTLLPTTICQHIHRPANNYNGFIVDSSYDSISTNMWVTAYLLHLLYTPPSHTEIFAYHKHNSFLFVNICTLTHTGRASISHKNSLFTFVGHLYNN